jgi:large subunit ribosomal protein L25
MEPITVSVKTTNFKNAKMAIRAGRIPVNYYAKGVKNLKFDADYQEFRRAYIKGGRSTIINFVTDDNKKYAVVVHDLQYNPVTDEIIHADVLAVDMNKVIHTTIPITVTGVSPAVKDLGGILVHNRDAVEVECMPKDLVHEIVVDISVLLDLHSSITVADITPPPGITIKEAMDVNIITVSVPRAVIEDEKPVAAAEAAAGGAAPAEGEKKEGEKAEAGTDKKGGAEKKGAPEKKAEKSK